MEKKALTLHEKWERDAASYEKGAKVKTAYPQCESCTHWVRGNALNCKIYTEERKPNGVLFAHTECPYYADTEPLKLGALTEKKSRFYGGAFGFTVGDMLGVPVEFSTRQQRDADPVKELRAYGTYHQPFGSWSDDSSLMFCLMDALLYDNPLEQLKKNMIAYYRDGLFTPGGQMFDIGNSTRSAIENMERGLPAVKCGGAAQQDNGNGSLMRVLPLAFLAAGQDSASFIRLIEDVSSLTHGHKRSKLACIVYVVFASQLYSGRSREAAFRAALSFVQEHCEKAYREEFSSFRRVFDQSIIKADRNQISSSGYVVDTLEAALWAFFNTSSYESSVLCAINLGGDTDTIAALVGGLAGIYYGYQKIPDNWIQNILKKQELFALFKTFFEFTEVATDGMGG